MPSSVSKSLVSFCLFAGKNCNSVNCSPRCSIHLYRKISELEQQGYLLKTNYSAELIVQGTMKLIFSSWQDFIDCVRDPQWSIADHWLGSWNNSQLWKCENIVSPLNPHLNVCYLPKILNFTTDMTSKWVTYRLHYKIY